MENCVVDKPSKIDWTTIIVTVITTLGAVAVAYVTHH